jgi:hypothetical protein
MRVLPGANATLSETIWGSLRQAADGAGQLSRLLPRSPSSRRRYEPPSDRQRPERIVRKVCVDFGSSCLFCARAPCPP